MVRYILNLLNHTLSDYNWNGPRDFHFVSISDPGKTLIPPWIPTATTNDTKHLHLRAL